MSRWSRRLRGALGLGVLWAAGGAAVGGAIELIWNLWPGFPLGPLVDIWPAALAIPGFLCGAAFSVVLGVAGRRRRFDELSLPRFTAWGALGGMLLGALLVAAGLGASDGPALGLRAVMIMAPTTLVSAVGAAGSLLLARMSEDPESLEALPEVPELRRGPG